MLYRPDLIGIEPFWNLVKRSYRARIRSLLAHGRDWDQNRLVFELMGAVREDSVKRCAIVGLQNMQNAQPVDPRKLQERYLEPPEAPFAKKALASIWGMPL